MAQVVHPDPEAGFCLGGTQVGRAVREKWGEWHEATLIRRMFGWESAAQYKWETEFVASCGFRQYSWWRVVVRYLLCGLIDLHMFFAAASSRMAHLLRF